MSFNIQPISSTNDKYYFSYGFNSDDDVSCLPANSAAHALHMPSHSLFRLGMFESVERFERAAWKIVKEHAQQKKDADRLDQPVYDVNALHSLQWLHYAQLQLEKHADARASLDAASRIDAAQPGGTMCKWYLARMYATHLVAPSPDTRDAVADHEAVAERETIAVANDALDMSGIEPGSSACRLFAVAWIASREEEKNEGADERGDRCEIVAAAVHQIDDLVAVSEKCLRERQGATRTDYYASADPMSIATARLMAQQLTGILHWLAKDKAAAFRTWENAASTEDRLPASYGPPIPVIPCGELLGEYYLADGDALAAKGAFERTLKRHRGRRGARRGLQQANAVLAGR